MRFTPIWLLEEIRLFEIWLLKDPSILTPEKELPKSPLRVTKPAAAAPKSAPKKTFTNTKVVPGKAKVKEGVKVVLEDRNKKSD